MAEYNLKNIRGLAGALLKHTEGASPLDGLTIEIKDIRALASYIKDTIGVLPVEVCDGDELSSINKKRTH